MDFILFVRWIPEKPTPFFWLTQFLQKKYTHQNSSYSLCPCQESDFLLLCKNENIFKVQLKFFVKKKIISKETSSA